jgi:hypothetical protein
MGYKDGLTDRKKPKQQGVAEGLGKDIKRLATGKDVKSRAGQEIAKSQDASMKGDTKTSKKHFDRYDKLDKLANKEQGVAEGSENFTITQKKDHSYPGSLQVVITDKSTGKQKVIAGDPRKIKQQIKQEFGIDYNFGQQGVAESRLYYNTIGTPDAQLRSDFNLRKDATGWFLKESAAPKVKLAAQRAFGSPKLKEYDLSVPSGPTLTKGDDNVISPLGSVTRKQLGK